MTAPKLVVVDGNLNFPYGGLNRVSFEPDPLQPSMLIKRYDAGDIDLIPWPMKSDFRDEAQLRKDLASALYDERETNSAFPYEVHVVELPDGTPFDFLAELGD
jgi:hypothetical protein